MAGKPLKFSLIEQSIATLLSCLVIAAFLQIFITQSRLFTSSERRFDAEANAILVSQLLRQSLQAAGYFGCRRLGTEFYSPPEALTLRSDLLQPVRITRSLPEAWPAGMKTRWLAGTAIVTVTQAREDILRLNPMNREDTRLQVQSGEHVQPDQWLLISNCQQAELVQVIKTYSLAGHQILITRTGLYYAYPNGSQANVVERMSWFVSREKQLYQWRSGEQPELWIEGVEALKGRWVGRQAVEIQWQQGTQEYTAVIGLRNA